VVITRTAFGNLLVGPTSEPQDDREHATVTESRLRDLRTAGEAMLPALAKHDVTALYAGLRPATEFSDYQIEAIPGQRWITVGGIRSTGLTAALGIAAHVLGLYTEHFGPTAPLANPLWPRVPNLTQALPRAEAHRDGDSIVCHCESVTRGDIRDALHDPLLAAGSLGGLKRRTRCMMGRCQGFYCSRRIVEMASGRLPELAARTETAA